MQIDESKIPTVELSSTNNGFDIYRCGDWSFELPDDGELRYAESGVYAWLGWWKFLKERENGTEA